MNIFGKKDKKANDKDNAKIKMVEVSQLHFDRDFKNVFQQENDKVTEIANDIIDWKCVKNNCENLQQLFSIYLH